MPSRPVLATNVGGLRPRVRRVALCLSLLSLIGCDPEGIGIDDIPEPDDGLVGRLVGPVSGVGFETASFAGRTDESGAFRYREGETVLFKVGRTVLGELVGKPDVSVFDLSDAEILVGTHAITRATDRGRGPFHEVINRATLLHQLDEDRNPENGIQISDEVSSLFQTISLDFDQHWWAFRLDPQVYAALATEGSPLEGQTLESAAQVMGDLYATLGVDPALYGLSEYTLFSVQDQDVYTRRAYAYGPAGFPTRIEDGWDGDRPGAPTRIEFPTYDAYGRVVRTEVDENGDGQIDVIEALTHDLVGRLTATERTDPDGAVLSTVTCSYYWRTQNCETDLGADGIIDEVDIRRYDRDINLTYLQVDSDMDGEPDLIYQYRYDEYGRRTAFLLDHDGDGVLEESSDVFHNDAGDVVEVLADYRDADGVYDNYNLFEYDEDYRLIRVQGDFGYDGSWNSLTDYDYDENGNRSGMDSWLDGRHITVGTYSHEPVSGWGAVLGSPPP